MKKIGEYEQSGKTDKMSTKRMDVTPDMASKWLERDKPMHHNRPISESLVAKYADDMKNGRWKEHHQGIAFGPDDEILDGQHRLWAIMESGTTQSMLVTLNMSLEAQRTVDDHKKRSVGDVMAIEMGSTYIVSTVHIATGNRMMHGNQHLQPPSRSTSMSYLTQHFAAIDFAVQSFGGKKMRGVTRAPVIAPMARAWYSYPHERIVEFAKVLVTGVYQDRQKDMAALLLRDYLIKLVTQNKRIQASAELVYMKAERALYAFLTNQPIGRLIEAGSELFPIDSDKRVVGAPKTRIASGVRSAHKTNLEVLEKIDA